MSSVTLKPIQQVLLFIIVVIIYNLCRYNSEGTPESPKMLPAVSTPTIPTSVAPNLRVSPGSAADQKTDTSFTASSTTAPSKTCNKRKFVKYTSSAWEQLWLDNIEKWQIKEEKDICNALFDQLPMFRKFMWDTCSFFPKDSKWCMKDDSTHRLWWNSENGRTLTYPPPGHQPGPNQPVIPNDPEIFSKFDFINECDNNAPFSEFIEPLVAHLRHPSSGCATKFCTPASACAANEGGGKYFVDRSWVIPPPTNPAEEGQKKYYFDGGASSWSAGQGGPSLSYFTSIWNRHGIDFDHIEAWEGSTTSAKFYSSVPASYRERTHYHHQFISSQPDDPGGQPFVPTVIKNTVKKEDYVLFKLDIDSGPVEQGTVDYLLDVENNDSLEYIDEFLWEHHVDNYMMNGHWGNGVDYTRKISDSYQLFLKLRNLGCRAHSWI